MDTPPKRRSRWAWTAVAALGLAALGLALHLIEQQREARCWREVCPTGYVKAFMSSGAEPLYEARKQLDAVGCLEHCRVRPANLLSMGNALEQADLEEEATRVPRLPTPAPPAPPPGAGAAPASGSERR